MISLKKIIAITSLTLISSSLFAMSFTGTFNGALAVGNLAGSGIPATGSFSVPVKVTSCTGIACVLIRAESITLSGNTANNVVKSPVIAHAQGKSEPVTCSGNTCTGSMEGVGQATLHFTA